MPAAGTEEERSTLISMRKKIREVSKEDVLKITRHKNA